MITVQEASISLFMIARSQKGHVHYRCYTCAVKDMSCIVWSRNQILIRMTDSVSVCIFLCQKREKSLFFLQNNSKTGCSFKEELCWVWTSQLMMILTCVEPSIWGFYPNKQQIMNQLSGRLQRQDVCAQKSTFYDCLMTTDDLTCKDFYNRRIKEHLVNFWRARKLLCDLMIKKDVQDISFLSESQLTIIW